MPLRSFAYDGVEWTVWDTHPEAQSGASTRAGVAADYTRGWLTFQCEEEKRRLAPVPAQWFELTEVQLAALLARADPVRRAPDMRF